MPEFFLFIWATWNQNAWRHFVDKLKTLTLTSRLYWISKIWQFDMNFRVLLMTLTPVCTMFIWQNVMHSDFGWGQPFREKTYWHRSVEGKSNVYVAVQWRPVHHELFNYRCNTSLRYVFVCSKVSYIIHYTTSCLVLYINILLNAQQLFLT